MKIGIISDVHGDREALVTALWHLAHHKVDKVLCAGDIIGRGREPEAVVEIIREQNIVTVQGNHDGWAYGMSPANMAYLQALPMDWYGEEAGKQLCMTHGKPGNNMWGIYPEHISTEVIDLMLGSLHSDVLVVGHTHVPMLLRGSQTMIVNPGSLYTFPSRRPSSHSYGVLTLPDMQFDLYDVLSPPEAPRPL